MNSYSHKAFDGYAKEEFAAFIGAPAALALNSCTAAFHVALATLGIGPGDAVITRKTEGGGWKGENGMGEG